MKKLLVVLALLVAYASQVTANEARIISMGKSDAFFMDEISVFRSPANLGVYGSFLIGDFGNYMDTTSTSSFYLKNQDPDHPWFGGFVGLGGDEKTSVGMFTIGAAINRVEKIDTLWFSQLDNSVYGPSKPQMPVDLVMAYNVNNNFKLGARGHFINGKYKETIGSSTYERSSLVGLGVLGARINLAEDKELEISGGLSVVAVDTLNSGSNTAENNIGYLGYMRLFNDINNSGDLVLSAGYEKYKYIGSDEYQNIYGGLGFNVLIDRGFLWFGGLVKQNSLKINNLTTKTTGASFNFGIERNVWWDWFVMRLGGSKTLGKKEIKDGSLKTISQIYTNNDATKFPDDAIGFGIGINIDDKLRFDGVLAEDIPFTFTNLMSGSVHHVFSRLSGTLAF